MVKLQEFRHFTYVTYVLSGPRTAVESAARVLEYCEPRVNRNYAMLDVTTGDWKVSLEAPRCMSSVPMLGSLARG